MRGREAGWSGHTEAQLAPTVGMRVRTFRSMFSIEKLQYACVCCHVLGWVGLGTPATAVVKIMSEPGRQSAKMKRHSPRLTI